MGKRRGFTLVELLVVIAIIALLMSILMPTLAKVKNLAKAAVCMSNLGQLGNSAQMYCNDNDGYFNTGNADTVAGRREHITHWASAWEPYYLEGDLRSCPTTPKSKSERDEHGNPTTHRRPFVGWGIRGGDQWTKAGHYGSYGINGYVLSRPPTPGNTRSHYWKRNDAKGAGYVPVLGDSSWIDGWPSPEDEPPEYEDQHYLFCSGMGRWCINRHYGGVNWVFLDNAVRRVGLKQLWLLKWHREFDVNGPWTPKGLVTRDDWADCGTGWTERFKEYKDPP